MHPNLLQHIVRGAQINSALYLIAVFVAGVWLHSTPAVLIATAAMGVTYLSYLIQFPRLQEAFPGDPTPRIVTPQWQKTTAFFVVLASILLGVLAGIILLMGAL